MEKNTNEIGFVELTVKLVRLIKKYYLLIIAFLVIGFILGFFLSKTGNIISYNKKMIFYSNYAPFSIINNYNYNLVNNNYKSVNSSAPVFSENNFKKIRNLYIDTLSQKGKVILQLSFVLSDTVGTANIFNEYFNNLDSTEYFKKLRNKNRIKNIQILEKICVKLDELEAVQTKARLSKNEQVIIAGESYKEYIDLFSLKLEYQEKVKKEGNFEMISESVMAIPSSTNRMFTCIKYVFAFLLTSFFIIFIIETVKKARSFKD